MSTNISPQEVALTVASTPTRKFLQEVIEDTPGSNPRFEMCIQCGTCGGSCPSGADMEYSPRRIFGMIEANMREEVLKANTFWYCVSCYYCMTRCPQEVHITDLMYTLKRKAIREGFSQESSASDAPDFSEFFVDAVMKYGRSFELGLATRYPRRIKKLDQLHAIIDKAAEIARRERVERGEA